MYKTYPYVAMHRRHSRYQIPFLALFSYLNTTMANDGNRSCAPLCAIGSQFPHTCSETACGSLPVALYCGHENCER